jgi:aminomethyltransferase
LEGGLGWITKFNKDFTAKAIIEKQKAEGIQRKLVGFEMLERGIPRHDYLIKDASGNLIGKVTSGTQAPSLNKAIGLGYGATAHAHLDSEIYIDIRNTLVKAKIVKAPFA